jgi:biotin-dependent carboxylase-like uncharacterized protein
MTALDVLSAGALTTVQDLGRPGFASTGVGRSGALDPRSLSLANRLVGNTNEAAGLEVTFGGLRVRPNRRVEVAVTGCVAPVQINGRPAGRNAVLVLECGDVLAVGPPSAGVRSYLAVRGGVTVPKILGSRSTDMLSGIGPPVVQAGDSLPIGAEVESFPHLEQAPVVDCHASTLRLRVILGPRHDWFCNDAIDVLQTATWTTTAHANRVGIRLDGPVLTRAINLELPSEGVVEGALQVPPGGGLTVFLADHPVTGGYPVIGVLRAADICLAAQARPGQEIQFVAEAGPHCAK